MMTEKEISAALANPLSMPWDAEPLLGGAYGEVLIPVVEDVIPTIPESGDIAVRIMDGLIEMNDSEVS